MIAFRSFQTRLIVFLLALMLPVLAGIFYFVNSNNNAYTEQTINRYLALGAGVFDFTRQEQSHTLLAIMSSLTWDFGFRTAYGSQDDATLFDASLNVLNRSMEAVDMLMVADLEGQVRIDTELQGFTELENEWRDLIEAAFRDEEGIAESVLTVHGLPYHVIAVPLYLPRQVAWIIGGFALDRGFLETVKSNTLSEVSLFSFHNSGAATVLASTLAQENWAGLNAQIESHPVDSDTPRLLTINGEQWGTLSRPLASSQDGSQQLFVLIQRSYNENIENEQRFRRLLGEFYLVILFVSMVAVLFLARSITNPLTSLATMVRKIEQGEYGRTVRIKARDELGQLADSVNSMASGLAEKERVRDLLGKVVSKKIAEQLLRNPVELGGEEKVVTILFVDIKGFTAFCEGRKPQQVLEVLNRYLSEITTIIEANNGVVDKFNGDAVMALFGAPIGHALDAGNAMHAALQIRSSVRELQKYPGNEENMALDACIGIHTGLVVAGNLGSMNRLNYSVIGDSVNLASRLESLTRFYNVSSIVSEQSRNAAPGFVYGELDLVQVFGKQEAVRIFQLIGEEGQVSSQQLEEIRRFSEFLLLYRNRQWDQAEQQIRHLSSSGICTGLAGIYQDRITAFKSNPPAESWCGVYTFDKK